MKVWVFIAEQSWDGEVADDIVRVFDAKEKAVKYLDDFIHDDGDESIVDYVKRRGWVTEQDEPMLYRAYEDGCYCTSRIELEIIESEIM